MTDSTETTAAEIPEEDQGKVFKARKPLDLDEVLRLRAEGKSLGAIGKLFQVSPMTVSRQLQAEGHETGQTADVRARVAQTASRKRWGDPDEFKREAVLKVAADHPDWPIRLIAAEADASYAWAWNVLRTEGIEVSPDKLGRKEPGEFPGLE